MCCVFVKRYNFLFIMSLSARDFVLQVIQKYKSYPCLWQVKHPDYHNKEKRNAAMNALLELFKTKDPQANLDTVKKKITTLRNCFKKELNKVKASERSGTAEIHVPKLWYYSELFFLADVDVPRVTRSVNSILEDMTFEDSAEKFRVTQEQRKVMLEFMMEHPDISQGRVPDAESARKKDEIIKELARHLNALESGTTKTPEKWWKCWLDWRSDTKAKALRMKKYLEGTGGTHIPAPLSKLEEILLEFSGVDPLMGTRQDTDYASDCASESLMDFKPIEIFNTLEECCNSKNLDQVMLSWYHEQSQKNIPISGPLIKLKAESLAEELGLTSFKASEGWLGKFKQRHHINYGKIERKEESRRPTLQETNSGSEDEESIVLDPDSELWGFFDKQPHNKAKCSMCDERLRRDADTLYKHLKEKHSKISQNLEYKDNEENFTEVIYLEEPIESIKEDQDKLLFEVQPKAKKSFKRRYSTRDDVKYIEPIKSQSKDDVEIENFGKYITGLLKGVPRAASSKLQMDIVTMIMNTKINLPTTPDIDSEVVERSKESDPPDIGQENQENQDNLDTTTSSELGTNQDTRSPKRPKRRISYREEYSYKINLTENEEREIENFGTYVTCLLKTVPENKISAKLQMNIVNLIMTARLQALQKNVPVLTINGTIELDNTNVDDNQVMFTDS
ncbi:uncharacterized protein LOC125058261 isoform X3 [Pieris napi]|uniref:uncharacterized protein LOC125058261 isoform X3 n=1 Tax=Pieris napi TaxID=78633 RepID=UPI001FB9CED0|nr:uncharacterized protein LOC125058261 isoform X3 [Pieris napi]